MNEERKRIYRKVEERLAGDDFAEYERRITNLREIQRMLEDGVSLDDEELFELLEDEDLYPTTEADFGGSKYPIRGEYWSKE